MDKPNPNFLFNILGGVIVGFLWASWGNTKARTAHYKLHHPEIPDKGRVAHYYGKQTPPATPTLQGGHFVGKANRWHGDR